MNSRNIAIVVAGLAIAAVGVGAFFILKKDKPAEAVAATAADAAATGAIEDNGDAVVIDAAIFEGTTTEDALAVEGAIADTADAVDELAAPASGSGDVIDAATAPLEDEMPGDAEAGSGHEDTPGKPN